MKMKTSSLEGMPLNWAVAIAWSDMERVSLSTFCRGGFLSLFHSRNDYLGVLVDSCAFYPSTKWSQGGPIIEQEKIDLLWMFGDGWMAKQCRKGFNARGPTPLIAAMRCFVASKLGDEVEIPEELCNV